MTDESTLETGTPITREGGYLVRTPFKGIGYSVDKRTYDAIGKVRLVCYALFAACMVAMLFALFTYTGYPGPYVVNLIVSAAFATIPAFAFFSLMTVYFCKGKKPVDEGISFWLRRRERFRDVPVAWYYLCLASVVLIFVLAYLSSDTQQLILAIWVASFSFEGLWHIHALRRAKAE